MSAEAARPAALSGRLEQAHRILEDRLRQQRGDAQSGEPPRDSVWSLMAPILRPYRWHLLGGIALNAIHGGAIVFQNFLLPILLATVADPALPLSTDQRLSRLLWLMLLYLLISNVGRMTLWHLGYRLFTHVRERAMRVLRPLVAHLLGHRGDVLAFASAPPAQGGTGATLVLLAERTGKPRDG